MNELPNARDIEKYCLSLMIRNPEILPDVLPFINSKDFYTKGSFHETIFQLIQSIYEEKKTVDKVLIISRANSLQIKNIEGVSIADYIEAISNINKITVDKWPLYFQELKKYSIARNVISGAREVEASVNKNLSGPVGNLISTSERIFVDCITSYIEEDYKPKDLHEGISEEIEERGNNPGEYGIVIPLELLHKKSGGFTPGDLTVFAAPAGAGKSTLLNYLAINCALHPKNNVKALILDTELETKRAQRRRISSLSGINEYYLRTGKWRNNAEMTEKVRKALEFSEKHCTGKVDHLYVANKTIDEVVSIVRRWVAHNIEKDVMPLIVYDYLKLTGETPTDSWKEYQIMGKKTDTIKKICSEVGAAGLAAVQTNAYGDVAMANQIKWFVSNLYILQPKTLEEVALHGKQWGTHKLTTVKERNQGEDASGFNKFVTVQDENGENLLVENTLFYDFSNFSVTEKGCLKDTYASHAGHLKTEEDKNEEDIF